MEIKRFIGGGLEANCYVVTSSASTPRPCFIIDPGYNPKKIIKYINDHELMAKGIILTHHHHDHSGGASIIRKELECPLMIHTMDADMYGGQVDVYMEDGDVIELADEGEVKGATSGEVATVDVNETPTASSESLWVLHTPGHTKGGICLMSAADKICFTGDTIFNVDLGRTDLEDGSEAEMRQSIRNVIDKWGNDIEIYPGHGDPATMKTVRKINKEFLELLK